MNHTQADTNHRTQGLIDSQPEGDSPIDRTLDLIQQAIHSAGAQDELVRRFLPLVQRWARGRLPRSCRDLADTDDLVQVAFVRALRSLKGFRSERQGAFLAYMRRAVLNALRDEIRRCRRRPGHEPIDETVPDGRGCALDRLARSDAVGRYEQALAELPERHQEAVIMRIELEYSFDEIAAAIGSPSAKAAHMMVSRALLRLSKQLHGYR